MSGKIRTEEFFIAIKQGKLFVKKWTPENILLKEPLFLFHDSLGCVELWRDFPLLLAQEFARPVIAYDRLGFGKSSARTELPSIHFVEEEAGIYFPQLVAALGVLQFEIFGHSVGGGIAIASAAELKNCLSVVTESAQAFVEQRTIDGILQAKKDFKDPKNFARLTRYHGEKALWVLRAWTEVWLSQAFANWSLAPLLKNVRCPVLALHGDQDEFGSVAFPEMIRDLAGGKSEMQIITSCGHVPHREKPEAVMSLLRKFYQSK